MMNAPGALQASAILCLLTGAMLSACAVGPDFVRPDAPTAQRYTRDAPLGETSLAHGEAQRFAPGAPVPADWWTLFKSAQLDTIVQQAMKSNPTLAAAQASLSESQNNLRAGYGVFYPQIGLGIDAEREHTSPLQSGSSLQGTVFNVVTTSGSVGYLLDVFGGKRRTVEALQAQAESQRYAEQAAYLTLSANVVNTVIARAAYAAQIVATEQLIALETQQLDATQAQVRAGTSPYASVLSIRSQIASNQALLAPLRQRVSQTEDLLATLQGQFPAEADLPAIDLSALSLPADLPVSLPSDLVRQRPDILEAEAQMHVASANIGVATAAMFPSISLSGTYGRNATSFGGLSADSFKFWSVGPSVTIPVFQGGSLWYGRKAAIDAYRQTQATYRQTVLAAFAQVADVLMALEHDAQALAAQEAAMRDAGDALGLLQVNYRAGMVGYLDVLAADVLYHQAIIAYVGALAQRQQDTVALFIALGGGWWNRAGAASAGE